MIFFLVVFLLFLLTCMMLIARHRELSNWAKLSLFLNPLFLIFALISTPIVSGTYKLSGQRALYVGILEEAASADLKLREKVVEILKDTSRPTVERLNKVPQLLHGEKQEER